MKVIYTFEDRIQVEGELDLDPSTERSVNDARTQSELRRILDPLITEHALSREQAANGALLRSIDFGIDGGRYDR